MRGEIIGGLALLAIGLTVVPLASAAADSTYTVQPGDTLSGIADMNGITVEGLMSANGLNDAEFIWYGQKLTIPSGEGYGATESFTASSTGSPGGSSGGYTVAPGDTLIHIASYFGVSVEAIARANALLDPNFIWAGESLTIPGAGSTTGSFSAQVQVNDAPSPGVPPYVDKTTAEAALRNAAANYGIDPSLVLGLAWMESGWQQHVVSYAGAVGLTQVLPGTAEWVESNLIGYEVDWWNDPYGNAQTGVAYLDHLIELQGGDVERALASYYQGAASLATYGMYDETVNYVQTVLYFAGQFN